MMPNITRGPRMTGLMLYLVGPGKANEHTEPHLVAGDPAIMAWHDDAVLDEATARDIARQIDQPRRVFKTTVTVPKRTWDDSAHRWVTVRDEAGKPVTRDGNVWHCSLSLKAPVYAIDPETGSTTAELVDGEAAITDGLWGDIARDFMREMGFAEEGLSPARWVAVHHGASKAGNDHIHIAATMVREDGTKVSVHDDYKRAQRIAGELERKYGLLITAGRAAGVTTPAHSRAEANIGAGKGNEPARRTLARDIRACATATTTEAEFVRQVRALGHFIRPRYASGTDDVVHGYSVALAPRHHDGTRDFAGHPVWFGGGRLGKDLTLPRLRHEWTDSATTSLEAAAEWRRAKRGRDPLKQPTSPPSSVRDAEDLYRHAHEDLAQWARHLSTIAPDDRAAWSRAAGQTAGVFAAWSARIEQTPGPLARAADALAASAGLPAHALPPKKAGQVRAGGAALLLLTASPRVDPAIATTILLRQLLAAVEAIAAAHRAAGDASRAETLLLLTRTELGALAATPQIAVEPRAETAGMAAGHGQGRNGDFPVAVRPQQAGLDSPVPGRLSPLTDAERTRLDTVRQRTAGHPTTPSPDRSP